MTHEEYVQLMQYLSGYVDKINADDNIVSKAFNSGQGEAIIFAKEVIKTVYLKTKENSNVK